MIEQLKKIFPTLCYHQTLPSTLEDTFKWYITEESHIIGIHQSELEAKDIALLNALLRPLHHLFPQMTSEEEKWKGWIFQEEIVPHIAINYRFVYFSIPTKQIDPQAFKEALNELFERETIILWKNEDEGVIIEIQQDGIDEELSYKEIIDIFMSDIYVNIKFFVGPFTSDIKGVKQHYEHLITGANIAFKYSDHHVISYLEAIPYILMEQIDPTFKKEVQKVVLQDFQHDTEFIKMIYTFLESNLNLSVAAKKLYMHRNSLQYRIDKFHEKTGIDVREFHQALTVYLALISTE
ncbi:PucR family transcriptional regulator [Ornithinibacillus xuwenensis]|uniref:Helix-turn-helix domain-containing protein n=1 Tax=Ornithinibacillus xuwenensis TaxID=3144668 RepID=A0ABU9XHG8_9BACI